MVIIGAGSAKVWKANNYDNFQPYCGGVGLTGVSA